MNEKISHLLENKGENYILPFFWQHGETEAVLREYMKVIDEANIGAVCVESRPHPDFCGEKWWQDMDVILDEARKRDMKVWILDDSHFPTGFANGAMKDYPDDYCRQSICCRTYHLSDPDCDAVVRTESGSLHVHIGEEEIAHPDPFEKNMIENFVLQTFDRTFDDDRLFSLYAVRRDEHADGFADPSYRIDLMPAIKDGTLDWDVPEGIWNIYAMHITRNMGFHRTYINMMDQRSCKVLLDAVYEPHWQHYKDDFGKTIAGFFSDEPELGNGHLYDQEDTYGHTSDYPWSAELEKELNSKMGKDALWMLPLLFENDADASVTAKVRYSFMDSVTDLVKKDFSYQIGNWCRSHGVQYIGHVIEDNNHHSRTSSSLGHYFRGLEGQDMAGIDDIGGQVYPQGEHDTYNRGLMQRRDGEFYHFVLGKLASSAAAIEPNKHGNSMCEIFGNYGWKEGVRLEKYLADHFLVRGINHYVPHAFTPMDFPDPDCPPHFYAHGHNPQYRHFGCLMKYMNRVCGLISDGHHDAPVAVIYSGEGDWTGDYMAIDQIGEALASAQLEYDIVPQDVFARPGFYDASVSGGTLKVNTQHYRAVVVPYMQFITKDFALGVEKMCLEQIPVLFLNRFPEGICDTPIDCGEQDAELIRRICSLAKTVDPAHLSSAAELSGCTHTVIEPSDQNIRCHRYLHTDGSAVYLLVNEGTSEYAGTCSFPAEKDSASAVYGYDAWENHLFPVTAETDPWAVQLTLLPLQSRIIVFDRSVFATEKDSLSDLLRTQRGDLLRDSLKRDEAKALCFTSETWKRSTCSGIDYPAFDTVSDVCIPDCLAGEQPEFSGYVRYENTFCVEENFGQILLQITDAYEGVEVFINGQSLGIQIAPPCVYDLTSTLHPGENTIRIEVATTLEREMYKIPNRMGWPNPEPVNPSGINGEVRLYQL